MYTDEIMDRNKLLQDTRGHRCGRCRQRLVPTTTNLEDIQCPACERVASSSLGGTNERSCNNKTNGRFSSTVSHVAEKFRNTFLGRHHRQDSDTEKPKSLNCNPSPLESSSTSLSDQRPRKRALLIGVTYKTWKHKLKGTVNDVKNMSSFLIENLKFPPQNILVLTEDETEPDLIPTKKNIEISLKWLVQDCLAGDSLVFYYSGHGLRQPDFNLDERDGFDETICPVDFLKEGMILDNYINSTIVQPLPQGVILHAIVDACHSGTILDLVHVYNREKREWEDNSPPNGTRKHTNGGLAISICACEDNQMAADTTAFTEKGMNGALTYILIETVKKYPGPTYGDLLDLIHETIDAVNNSGCHFSRFIRSVFHNKILQTPQLSASKPFDVKKTHFIL
ncbi:hypothetical protein GH714_007433 [Hevea brasiliensis]|uniref:Peptidase C14 caspase domain-containing protein n=1 Tax=Hevea brasiliensis TaxID=3981 RepID=A0A6A6L339_HEVBR|nr:hypothetical protein GH714_007433 [Hevea brasiliensis]